MRQYGGKSVSVTFKGIEFVLLNFLPLNSTLSTFTFCFSMFIIHVFFFLNSNHVNLSCTNAIDQIQIPKFGVKKLRCNIWDTKDNLANQSYAPLVMCQCLKLQAFGHCGKV